MASSSSADAAVGQRASGTVVAWLLAAVIVALAWWFGNLQRETLLDDLERKGRQELDLYVSYLSGQLNRYAFLPALLADDFRLQSLLLSPNNREQQEQVNRFLGHVNQSAGSLDVYLMDARGVTVAASNWQDEVTFVGRNFGFRPYFTDAMQGRAGRYYALGTTSGRRGYYFSHPVGDRDDPQGVAVVKIDIDTFEDNWRKRDSDVIVTDPDGVIFVSTRPEWRYRTIEPLDAETIDRVRASRRYPDADLAPVFRVAGEHASGARVLELADGRPGRRLSIATDMPQAGWRVQLLISQSEIASRVWQVRLLLSSLLLLLATGSWLALQRSRRRRELDGERRRAMEEALAELEQRVDRRTADLTEANRLLRREAEEHERTRDELIQAAKLAALGQMSAGINHELNQPLAAMRTYAENARTYLARENLDQVGWNLQQISELTARMAQISGQLKVFSRKSSGQRIRISLRSCLEGARRIVSTRLQQAGAELQVELPTGDLFVAGDMVQLEQVLVNLIGNACDAMRDQPHKRILVSAQQVDGTVQVQVRDTGPGIAEENLGRVFDPFFTTSDSGLGLGLSISHTIVQRLGGSLRVANAAQGGAVFTLSLAVWEDD